MIVAAVVSIIFRQLRQPVVLGYILAGVIVGPYTPPFPLIEDKETINMLSELGVIFLMFSLGLEFSLRKLKQVGGTAFLAASFEILFMVWAGFQLGRAFGWSTMDSVFLGAILSISSTTIIIKALEELGKTKQKFAGLIFGILIVEDILAIVMIALLSGFATTGELAPKEVGFTILKLSAFLGVLLVGGLILVPRLLNYVARFKSDEMLLVATVGLCFGVCLLAVKLGYSVALGAFLIGAIIAEARQIHKVELLTHPVRDLFSAVFFVSIGLLIDPRLLWKYAGPISIISLVVIVGKVLTCTFGTLISGHDSKNSLKVGMGLAQIGEFSFIIAALGLSLKVTSDFLYPIAVAVSAITTLTTPYLVKAADPLANWLEQKLPRPLSGGLEAYSRWVSGLGSGKKGMVGTLVRKWLLQIGLNLLLTAAVFIFANWCKSRALLWWPTAPGGEQGMKAMVWIAAFLISLPLLIASVRKLQALGMLVAEASVPPTAAGEKTEALRGIISTVVFIAGCVGLLLVVLLLSAAILPSRGMLVTSAALVFLAAVVMWRSSIRVYANAQIALRDTFKQPPTPKPAEAPAELMPLLKEAQLKHVEIMPGSPGAGRLIGELQLRSVSGASIVGIEREGGNTINPGPDEELRPGDKVLLLGSAEQLVSGQRLLALAGA